MIRPKWLWQLGNGQFGHGVYIREEIVKRVYMKILLHYMSTLRRYRKWRDSRIAVGDRVLWGMQDFDFNVHRIKFAQI